MTEHDRSDRERPKVKVTDKRRIRPTDEVEGAPERATMEAAGGAGGSAEEAAGAASPQGEGAPEPGRGGADAGSELERARAQVAEYLDHLQRLKAEFENYRKRVLKEQTRAVEFATGPLMHKLLEVVDEFELALTAAEQFEGSDRFVHGVEMVYAKLMEILRSEGLERIDAEGKPFDPSLHEALLQEDGGEGEPVVVDVLRTGYTLKGRVVRPAGVKVGRR